MTAQTIVQPKRISSFGLTKTIYPPQLAQPRHRHEAASLSFVIAGTYSERCERNSRTCHPSTLVVHPAGEFHSVEFHRDPVQILNVQADQAFVSRYLPLTNALSEALSCQTATIARLGSRLVREFTDPDDLSGLAVEGIVIELLVEVIRERSRKDEPKKALWLDQARDFLHDNFSQPLGLEEVGKTVGIHPVHLARVFRRRFGCTMGEYVRLLRVEFAKKQLFATDRPVCEIALAAGFSDQSHLNKTFKAHLGLTPCQYRKSARRG
jgi:AraC family transcriptional regulator